MNRIEKILEEAESQLAKYPDDELWIGMLGKQVAFYKWLLEESDELPLYELHQPQVEPTVWGMGDVSHHIRIQLQKIKTPASPAVLVFDYQSPAPKVDAK